MVSIMAKNVKNSDTVLIQSKHKLKYCFSFSLIFTDEDSASQFAGKMRTDIVVNNRALFFLLFCITLMVNMKQV